MKKLLLALSLTFVILELAAQGTRVLRQPTLSDEYVVFIHANDLWRAPKSGGDAVRLTTFEGYESAPHFSKDSKTIAFSAEYDGNIDVYTVPVTGGTPKRVTYHPGPDFVEGWTPEGDILFRTGRRGHPTKISQLYTVSPEGGYPNVLVDIRATYGEISPDGKHLAYTPISSWDPEWRNYRGGQAMPIWILNLETFDLIRTPQPDKERHLYPVWVGEKIYYLSERDLASNIWSYDINTGEEEQITFHKKFDVKSLSANGTEIAYEQGGYLHLLNTANKSTQQLEINVQGDLNFSRARWDEVTGSKVLNPQVSPNGKRALFEYRGDIFTFPKEEGSWRNLTESSNAADRYPIWSPEGDKIAWFTDESGEYQLVVADQFGQDRKYYDLDEEQPSFYFTPDWSPNGKMISFTDTHYNLWYIDLGTGRVKKVDTDGFAHPNRTMNPNWSPDSRYIAYEKQQNSHFKAIWIYDTQSDNRHQVSDGLADATSAAWDQSGEYLYFLASTNYGLNTGWLDMSSYDPQTTRSLYALVLTADGKAHNIPTSDEEEAQKEEEKEEEKKKKKAKDAKEEKAASIDFDGIQKRVVALKLPARNYPFIKSAGKHQLFIAESIPNETGLKVHQYDVKKEKAEDFLSGVSAMVVSKNGEHTLFQTSGSWSISGTKSKPKPDDKIKVSAKMKVVPHEEYRQMFKEGWRFMRDFLYVDNVHGAPWEKVYNWYEPWLDHVHHRRDLNYLIEILSGEVSIGHSYVSGGDMPNVNRVPVGLLGADFELADGRYRIQKIYSGEDWNPNISAPLAVPGMKVKEGDYIISIEGREITEEENIYEHLAQTAGRTIRLTVNSRPTAEGAVTMLVNPVASENSLRYIDWVEGNRRKVDALSDGKLAYVYIPNTSGPGFTSFNRYYFSQQDKQGVVLDERNNGGGSAADYIIDILTREPVGYFNSKAGDNRPWTSPIAGIWGPKVMIINERAGSGGDLLPYMFHKKSIGPLVGTRTWGGLVGTWDTPRFVDGGRMVAPRGGFFDTDGEWAVEGEGVAPDIEVIDEPKIAVEGGDAQLERAVKEALKLLETEAFELKPEPAAPVRWVRPDGYDDEK